MSLKRPSFSNQAGVGIFIEDDQLWADSFAAADDRVYETLFFDGTMGSSNQKAVLALQRPGGLAEHEQRWLVIPGPGAQVYVEPAVYLRGTPTTAGLSKATLAHTQLEELTDVEQPALGIANGGGAARWDCIYATIQRAVADSGARLVRDEDDNESTQSVDLTDETTLTISKVSSAVSLADALSLVGADGANAYKFPLAVVVVDAAYAGGPIAQTSAGGTTYITQQWTAAAIEPWKVRSLKVGAVADQPAVPLGSSVYLPSRFRSKMTYAVPFRHTANPQSITLDSTINWARRFVQIRMYLPPVDGGAYKPVDEVSVASNAGFTYGTTDYAFTGLENQTFKQITLNGKTYDFKTNASGALGVTCNAAPNAAADNWWVEIETTPPFDVNS